jgi:hypothetical protein
MCSNYLIALFMYKQRDNEQLRKDKEQIIKDKEKLEERLRK